MGLRASYPARYALKIVADLQVRNNYYVFFGLMISFLSCCTRWPCIIFDIDLSGKIVVDSGIVFKIFGVVQVWLRLNPKSEDDFKGAVLALPLGAVSKVDGMLANGTKTSYVQAMLRGNSVEGRRFDRMYAAHVGHHGRARPPPAGVRGRGEVGLPFVRERARVLFRGGWFGLLFAAEVQDPRIRGLGNFGVI